MVTFLVTRFLRVDELRRFLFAAEQLSPHLCAFFTLLVLTGRRKSEIQKMKWCDVNLEESYFQIPRENCKTKNKKYYALSEKAVEVLERLPKNSEFVFPSPADNSKPFFNTQKPFEKLKKFSGLADIRIHDLRRSLPSHLAMLGKSCAATAAAIGDTQKTTEKHYVRFDLAAMRSDLNDYSKLLQ